MRARQRIRSAVALATGGFLLPLMAWAAPVTTVAAFDPAGGGVVESDATGAPNDRATFGPAVSAAFTAGRGGVINFEVAENTAGTSLEASYASGAKTLNITASEAFSIQTFSGSTPVSGTFGLLLPSANDSNDNATLTFTGITGGEPGEAVTSVGFALLSRNTGTGTSDYTQTVTVIATFSDGSTATASDTINGANGTDDTFFGFTAPAGLSIASIGFDPALDARDSRTVIDDLGFVTSVVPEPASASLVVLAAGGLLARRRRRVAG